MRKYLLIAAGGFIGASARYLIKSAWLPVAFGDFPLDTLFINLTGCFLLSFIMAAAFEIRALGPNIRLGITTGLIGAFTTFSTVSRETAELISVGIFGCSVIYLTVSAALGFAFTFFGVIAARSTGRFFAERKQRKLEREVM